MRTTKRVRVWHLQSPVLLQQDVSEKSLVIPVIFLFMRSCVDTFRFILCVILAVTHRTVYARKKHRLHCTPVTVPVDKTIVISGMKLITELSTNMNTSKLVERVLSTGPSFPEWKQIYSFMVEHKNQRRLLKNMLETAAGVFEIPTRALLDVLCPLLLHIQELYDVTEIVSVGAGRALIEACIANRGVHIIATSQYVSHALHHGTGVSGTKRTKEKESDVSAWPATIQTPFMDVKELRVREVDARVVYASWMHPSFEHEIHENPNLRVLVLTGEVHGSCYSDEFVATMKQNGFNVTRLRTKGFCSNDHCYVFAATGQSVSYTTVFWKNTTNIQVTEDKLLSQVDKQLLWPECLPSELEVQAQHVVDLMFWKDYSIEMMQSAYTQLSHPKCKPSATITSCVNQLISGSDIDTRQ
jgi:hypothetical protein